MDAAQTIFLIHSETFWSSTHWFRVIEAAGHLCIFLPKYRCELNFIVFFWGAVKRYLSENCDYTFATLQSNLPLALASVSVELIPKWEHQSLRWMEAYQSGLLLKDAQEQVQAFNLRKYKLHRRILETLARTLDTALNHK